MKSVVSDSGKYKCIAENSSGKAEDSVSIAVTGVYFHSVNNLQ